MTSRWRSKGRQFEGGNELGCRANEERPHGQGWSVDLWSGTGRESCQRPRGLSGHWADSCCRHCGGTHKRHISECHRAGRSSHREVLGSRYMCPFCSVLATKVKTREQSAPWQWQTLPVSAVLGSACLLLPMIRFCSQV